MNHVEEAPNAFGPEGWQRVRALFAAALERVPGERAAYLRNSTGDDEALRREVLDLLAHHEASRGTLAPDALLDQVRLFTEPETSLERLGPYRILGMLGRGGMGVVYRAEQEQPRRAVALKVIQPLALTLGAIRRFEHEAELLARLCHPGIAQIYEVGRTEMGGLSRPYFAMELVEGQPLTHYAESRALGLRARLELFASVCDAVHHAHQKGVLHRDLKPANILVGEGGRTKVLDFGVARAMDGEERSASSLTAAGQLLGTLPYMSPEQLGGDPRDLDTRSDVYALGVVLYELLSGRLPHELANRPLIEAARIIRDQEARPLGLVDRKCRGDLETIAAKALEKDRARRYASASDLAEDVRRYLRVEPISARPASAVYHLGKFARRNRALVLGLGAAFLALVLGILGTSWQAVRAMEQRDRAFELERKAGRALTAEEEARRVAQREAASANAVQDLLVEILGSPDPAIGGRDVRVIDQLEQGLRKLDPGFEGPPEVEAAVRAAIARTYLALGIHGRAAEQAERAAQLFSAELGPTHEHTLAARTHFGLALGEAGDHERAGRELADVEAIYRQTQGEDSVSAARAAARHAAMLYQLGDYDAMAAKMERSLAIAREGSADDRQELSEILNGLAVACTKRGDHARAVELWKEAIALLRSDHEAPNPDLALTIANLACGYLWQRRPDLAEPLLLEAIEMQRHVYTGGHPQLAVSLETLAGILVGRADLVRAGALAREACDMYRAFLPKDHAFLARSLHTLAAVHYSQGDYAAAETELQEAVRIRDARPGEAGEAVVEAFDAKWLLARTLSAEERYSEAAEHFRQILPALDFAFPPDNLRGATTAELGKAEVRYDAGRALHSLGSYAEAEPLLVEAFQAFTLEGGETGEKAQRAVRALVELFTLWERPEELAEWSAMLTTSSWDGIETDD